MVKFAGYSLQLDKIIREELKEYNHINILELVEYLKEVDDNADIDSYGESILISASDFDELKGIAIDIVGMVEDLGNEITNECELVGNIIRSANISTYRS